MSIYYFNTRRVKYILSNWKIGIHLLLRTKRFGVNNEWWAHFDSGFGAWTVWDRIKALITITPLIESWNRVRFRAGACHILTDESYKLLYGETKEDYLKRTKHED